MDFGTERYKDYLTKAGFTYGLRINLESFGLLVNQNHEISIEEKPQTGICAGQKFQFEKAQQPKLGIRLLSQIGSELFSVLTLKPDHGYFKILKEEMEIHNIALVNRV